MWNERSRLHISTNAEMWTHSSVTVKLLWRSNTHSHPLAFVHVLNPDVKLTETYMYVKQRINILEDLDGATKFEGALVTRRVPQLCLMKLMWQVPQTHRQQRIHIKLTKWGLYLLSLFASLYYCPIPYLSLSSILHWFCFTFKINK